MASAYTFYTVAQLKTRVAAIPSSADTFNLAVPNSNQPILVVSAHSLDAGGGDVMTVVRVLDLVAGTFGNP